MDGSSGSSTQMAPVLDDSSQGRKDDTSMTLHHLTLKDGITTLRHPVLNPQSTKLKNFPKPQLHIQTSSPSSSFKVLNEKDPPAVAPPSVDKNGSDVDKKSSTYSQEDQISIRDLNLQDEIVKNVFLSNNIRSSLLYDPIATRRQRGRRGELNNLQPRKAIEYTTKNRWQHTMPLKQRD